MKPYSLDQRQYRPVGRCIYCGAVDLEANLTREHIIPYSLGGRTVLPKANCATCAKITREFEQTCARTIFGPFRIQENFPTRHAHERPAALPIRIIVGDREEERLIPVDSYPGAPVMAMELSEPGIITGAEPSSVYQTIKPMVFAPEFSSIEGRLKSIREQEGPGKGIALHGQFNMPSFGRLLAKIGHAYAVAEYGLDSFEPLLLDLILGRDDKIAYLVGGSRDPLPDPPVVKGGQFRHHQQLGIYTMAARHFLCARLQLFSVIGLPVYWVVVGIPSAELVQRLLGRALPKGP
jgi:hypothetical protein